MTRYMLDTNTVSYLIRKHPLVSKRVMDVPMAALCISAITEGELLFGLEKLPGAKRLHVAVRELLLRVDVLPWDRATAACYGVERAKMEGKGKILGSLDLLIATHAQDVGAILVTSDRAFGQVTGLLVEDWTLL